MTPTHLRFAALHVQRDDWLDAHVLELEQVTTLPLEVESRYLNPLSLALAHAVPVLPGVLELNAGLSLTLSAWQTTYEPGSPADPPLLLCSSGSVAEALLGATIAEALKFAIVAGVQDDPLHFDDGADCLGDGPAWQSSRWVTGVARLRMAATWQASFEVGHVEHRVHVEHQGHGNGAPRPDEHVSVRSARGVEGGIWLTAEL
jgi:hypothetical protein